MKNRYDILAYLYGEPADRDAVRARLQSDEQARREHDALAEAKFCLDHRKRQRPSPAVLGALAEAAAAPAPSASARHLRHDRAPVTPRLARLRRRAALPLLGAVLSVAALVGFGTWPEGEALEPSQPVLAAEAAPPAAPPRVQPAPEPQLPATSPALTAPAPASSPSTGTPSTATLQTYTLGRDPGLSYGGGLQAARQGVPPALRWDDAEVSRRLHQRVQHLKARAAADATQW